MPKQLLIDYLYRNLCFFDFLEESLKTYETINKSENFNKCENKMNFFLSKNSEKFESYKKMKKIAGKYSIDEENKKVNKIIEWAKSKGIILKEDITLDEVNYLTDKIFYIEFKDKMTKLIVENNIVLRYIFSRIIQHFFKLFESISEIKLKLFSNMEAAQSNYAKAMNEKERKIKENDIFVKSLKNDIQKYTSKIKFLKSELNTEREIGIKNYDVLKKKLDREIANRLINEKHIYDKLNEEIAQKLKIEKKFIILKNKFDFEKCQRIKESNELKDVKRQLNDEKTKNKKIEEELKDVKRQLNDEKTKNKKIEEELKDVKRQLNDEKTKNKKMQDELDDIKIKLELILKEKNEKEIKLGEK